MKTLIIDNYDSFTYNLFQLCAEAGGNPEVMRNDAIGIADILSANYTHIIISPGPGHPSVDRDFGVCKNVILEIDGNIPTLGVCLGHQGLGLYHGASVVHAPSIMHGKTSIISHDGNTLFHNIPSPFRVMRYHSFTIDPETLSRDFKVTSQTDDGIIMSIEHKTKKMFGVQFHPESIETEHGNLLLSNFLGV